MEIDFSYILDRMVGLRTVAALNGTSLIRDENKLFCLNSLLNLDDQSAHFKSSSRSKRLADTLQLLWIFHPEIDRKQYLVHNPFVNPARILVTF